MTMRCAPTSKVGTRFILRIAASAVVAVSAAACTPGGGDAPADGSGGIRPIGQGSGGNIGSGSGGASSVQGSGGATTSGSGGATASGSGGSTINGSGGGPNAGATGGANGTIGGRSGSGGSAAGSAGTTGMAGRTGAGGATAVVPGTFQKAAGKIPNVEQPASVVNLAKADWQKGILSPTLLAGKALTQPVVFNGYLLITGNEEFWFYDVSNPASPKLLSSFASPTRRGAEAESHTISFARYGNTFYMVTVGGTGVDLWDVTNVMAPKHVTQVKVPNTDYGDYTEAIWGVSWQGQYIYVGATNNGIKVIDAASPAAAKIVAEVPTSQYGGVSGGPVDAVGNVLVVTTPKENGGVATLDISDPLKPTRLASFSAGKSYIGQFYRRWVFLISPLRAWDVLTNPKSIGTSSTPVGQLNHDGAEYLSFSDDYLFLGHVRAEISGTPGVSKISLADIRNMKVTSRIWGRQNLSDKNDDQFNITFGNLIAIADDQAPYHGWFIAAHQSAPDTKPPVVDTVIPNNAATGVSTKSRIGISFSDNIELATVNAASFIVRPVGGEPLPGKWGARMGVLNFDPDADLQPATTYEVVLPKGGIADLAGNTMANEWKSTFTTN